MPQHSAKCVPNDKSMPISPPLFTIGQRVCIAGVKPGIIRYYGKTKFADGDWCGIELDENDGKHNGTVEGHSYFECEQGYGIFAPSHKVNALVVEKTSKLQQPKASGLKRLSKSRSRSPDASPSREWRSSKDPIDVVTSSETGSQSAPQSPRFVSKLLRPKAKRLTSSQSDSDSLDGKAYPLNGAEALFEKTATQRPSKLPKQSSALPIRRSQSALEPSDVKKYHSTIPKSGVKKENVQSLQQGNEGLTETYSLSDLKQAHLDGKSISRSERQIKARSLSHDLTGSDSQLPFPLGFDPKQKDTVHMSSNSSLCSQSSSKGSLASPCHDLLTPSAIIAKKNPVQFGGEAMSEPEDETDFLASSNISHASSLGILSDSVLCNNNLVTNELHAANVGREPAKVQQDESDSKESTEMMEKDLDQEISGISTPDMSSSTISGKDLCSSPDTDETRSLETQNASVEGKNDAPTAGENLATPVTTSSESSPDSDATKIQTKSPATVSGLDKQPSHDASIENTANDSQLGSKRNSLNLMDDQQYPRVMRTSIDLDELDSSSMCASVEIAKTAVQQYAELMAAAEKERQASVKHREHMAARRAARRSSAGSDRAQSHDSDSDSEFVLHRSASSGAVDNTQYERTQLMSDLEAGHTKQERPMSMISTGSADTGIVADLPGLPSTPHRRERPLSLVSTTSVDTGYQPDTDSEVGTLTTNSPLDEECPSRRGPPQEELSPRSAALSLDAAYQDTILKFQRATQQGSSSSSSSAWPSELTSDSGIYSDTATLIGESGIEHEALDLDGLFEDRDLMGEQDLLEFGLGQMLGAMPGACAGLGMRRGSPTNLELLSLEEEEPGSSTEEDDIALHEGLQTPISDIHAPMETIPEQDTPESPDVDLASSLQLTSFSPGSPVETCPNTTIPTHMATGSNDENRKLGEMTVVEEVSEPSEESPEAYLEKDLNVHQVTTQALEEPAMMEDKPVQDDNKAAYDSDDSYLKSNEELNVKLKDEINPACKEKTDMEKSQIESETTTMYDSLDDINKVLDLPLDRSQFIDSLEQSQAELLVNQVVVPENEYDDLICEDVIPTDKVNTDVEQSKATISDSKFLETKQVSIEEQDVVTLIPQKEQFPMFTQETDATVSAMSAKPVAQNTPTVCDSGFLEESQGSIEVNSHASENVQLAISTPQPDTILTAKLVETSKTTICDSGFMEESKVDIEENSVQASLNVQLAMPICKPDMTTLPAKPDELSKTTICNSVLIEESQDSPEVNSKASQSVQLATSAFKHDVTTLPAKPDEVEKMEQSQVNMEEVNSRSSQNVQLATSTFKPDVTTLPAKPDEAGKTTICDSEFMEQSLVNMEEVSSETSENVQLAISTCKPDETTMPVKLVESSKSEICNTGFLEESKVNIEEVSTQVPQDVQLATPVCKPDTILPGQPVEQNETTISDLGSMNEKQNSIESVNTHAPKAELLAMSTQEPGTTMLAEPVIHSDIEMLGERKSSGLLEETIKNETEATQASKVNSTSEDACSIETVKVDTSEVLAKAEDALITPSKDTISTNAELLDSEGQKVVIPEATKEEVILERLSRDSVQGLPPPLEPDVDSTASTTPESEVNQNFGAAWTEPGPPEVAITPAEEECNVSPYGGYSVLGAVVEEMISPEKANEVQAGMLPPSVGDMICIRDAIPADAIGASAELTELAVEELILPAGATLVGSAKPQFASRDDQLIPECIDVKPQINKESISEVAGLIASSVKHQEITEKEKASVDEDKDIVKETIDDAPAETMMDVPCIVKESVKPEGETIEHHIESVTEHEVLVETLDVTEGPLLRTSTPVSEVIESQQSSSDDQEILETEVVPELALSETHSTNTTFTDNETVPLVEIEIVSASEMSESTMKDTGHEKGLKEKEKECESMVDEKKVMKKNGTKLTKSKKIEDVAKADQKKTLSKTSSSLKDTKSKLTSTGKTTTKDNGTLKNKVSKPNTTKTSLLKKTETEKKPTTGKAGSRLIGNYNKESPKPKTKEDNTAVVNNVKTAKNNNNMKKADSGAGGDRKNPVVVQRRNPAPKSKWGNIMSQIDSGKSNKTDAASTKTKAESKTMTGKISPSSFSVNRAKMPRVASSSTVTTPRSSLTTPRTGPGSIPSTPRSPRDTTTRTTTASARRASSANASEAKPKTVSSSSLHPGRTTSTGSNTGRTKQSPEPTRSESRQSNASESSILNTSRSGSLPGSRPTSASKPGNRKTASLRRERSPSVGSEASGSSQVSSHSSRTPRTKEATPEPARHKGATLTKRRSLAEPLTRPGIATDKVKPRRASLAISSQMASRKEGSPSSLTDKKTFNQNRNKTTKSSTYAAASGTTSAKRAGNQPDVVTQVVPPGAAAEIGRLEALCETRTKQLNIARMQLKTSAQGFDAMTVLVKYLTDELDAFSCPAVTAKLKSVKGQLAEAQQQIDLLAEEKAILEKSLGDLKTQHTAKVTQVKDAHREELQQLQQRLLAEKDTEVEKVVEKYSLEVTTLKSFLEKNITEMKTKHEKTLAENEVQQVKEVKQLKEDHDGHCQDLQKQHEHRMEEITRTFENIKFALSEKVETLREECEEMRSREAHLEARTQREADMKVHMALAQYKHLPAEIESLKAVMEMRNQELHELRHRKLELEKQLEEIPVAREKIISLQQKVENLEAVIQIKADYEKQLAEKHQLLLRKFDKEYKANKRLSMDNEELAWRLANSAESPDLLRRSISHSPTRASAEPTPEVVRRRRSPACSIPTSPRNQTEFDRSPVMLQSPPKTNLKRSGTYDLLNKEPDEKDLKQSDVW